ncbi:MAG: hypothetical protein Q4B85_12280, partial [Lachnospiraceae bacterium]|nr:hypothetical protein [Lachnospiraceae bacterium]
ILNFQGSTHLIGVGSLSKKFIDYLGSYRVAVTPFLSSESGYLKISSVFWKVTIDKITSSTETRENTYRKGETYDRVNCSMRHSNFSGWGSGRPLYKE